MVIRGGNSKVRTSGSLLAMSGLNVQGSSGTIELVTTQSGTHGVSGRIEHLTRASSAGDSGSISVSTGNAFDGSGGDMKFAVGDSGYNDGGDIIINAGQAHETARQGRSFSLKGDEGSSANAIDGGNGGHVSLLVILVSLKLFYSAERSNVRFFIEY